MTEPEIFSEFGELGELAKPAEERANEGWEAHLEELRRRIIAVLVVFCAATLAAFLFAGNIAAFLTAPLESFHVKLYTFAPAEKFTAYLRLSAWTGVVATTPFLCAQTAIFIWPALRGRERRYAAISLFGVPVLFFAGAAASYRLLSPLVFRFFLSFASGDGVGALWGFRQYLELLAGLMLASGLLLQLPLAMLALFALGIVRPEAVARTRPQIILLIFFLAAVATPPDVLSQVMLGIPLYLLFEATLFLGRRITKKR